VTLGEFEWLPRSVTVEGVELQRTDCGGSCWFFEDRKNARGLKVYLLASEGLCAWAAQSIAAERGFAPRTIGLPFLVRSVVQGVLVDFASFWTELAAICPLSDEERAALGVAFARAFGRIPGDALREPNCGRYEARPVIVDFGARAYSASVVSRASKALESAPDFQREWFPLEELPTT
jgi:hypothetical protein